MFSTPFQCFWPNHRSPSWVLLWLCLCTAYAWNTTIQAASRRVYRLVTLIICQSNHRARVPMFFEDREWRHNLRQSQLYGFHAALSHNCISKSVNVEGASTCRSVLRPITLVVFSHPMTHHPSQKIMEGIFLLVCRSLNVAVVAHSLRLITVWFMC